MKSMMCIREWDGGIVACNPEVAQQAITSGQATYATPEETTAYLAWLARLDEYLSPE